MVYQGNDENGAVDCENAIPTFRDILVAVAILFVAAIPVGLLQDEDTSPNGLMLASSAICGLLLWLYSRYRGYPFLKWSGIGMRPIKLGEISRYIIYGVGLYLLLSVVQIGNAVINHSDAFKVPQLQALFSEMATTLIFLVPMALIEEILFRGLLQRGWAAKYGNRSGILVSATLFAALSHTPGPYLPLHLAVAFLCGIALGVVALRRKTIIASWLTYSSYLLCAKVLPYFVSGPPGWGLG